MAQKPNDGGPAFPRPASSFSYPLDGMSLRDYFAAQALTGIVGCHANQQPMSDEAAAKAYAVADAMLTCREEVREVRKKTAPTKSVAVLVRAPEVVPAVEPPLREVTTGTPADLTPHAPTC